MHLRRHVNEREANTLAQCFGTVTPEWDHSCVPAKAAAAGTERRSNRGFSRDFRSELFCTRFSRGSVLSSGPSKTATLASIAAEEPKPAVELAPAGSLPRRNRSPIFGIVRQIRSATVKRRRMERTDILIDNFKESLKQIQSYLFWAYVLNLTVLWLIYRHPELVKGKKELTLPPFPVAMDTVTAELTALVISIGLGYAIYAVSRNAFNIIRQLQQQPDTVIALFTFPTVSAVESAVVRWIAFLLPPAMLMGAVIIDAWRSYSGDLSVVVGGVLMSVALGGGPYARAAETFHDLLKFRRQCEIRTRESASFDAYE